MNVCLLLDETEQKCMITLPRTTTKRMDIAHVIFPFIEFSHNGKVLYTVPGNIWSSLGN
jgi:hypothetical protein